MENFPTYVLVRDPASPTAQILVASVLYHSAGAVGWSGYPRGYAYQHKAIVVGTKPCPTPPSAPDLTAPARPRAVPAAACLCSAAVFFGARLGQEKALAWTGRSEPPPSGLRRQLSESLAAEPGTERCACAQRDVGGDGHVLRGWRGRQDRAGNRTLCLRTAFASCCGL